MPTNKEESPYKVRPPQSTVEKWEWDNDARCRLNLRPLNFGEYILRIDPPDNLSDKETAKIKGFPFNI